MALKCQPAQYEILCPQLWKCLWRSGIYSENGLRRENSSTEQSKELPWGPSWGPLGIKASEGLVNSGQSLLSSCAPSLDAVLLRDTKASFTVQLLATVTTIHTPWDFGLDAHMHVYTCKLKNACTHYLTVGTASLLPVRKQTVRRERSGKHTQRHRYAWTHTDYRHKQMSADIRLHASHTYAWTHRHASEHRCGQTNVNVLVQSGGVHSAAKYATLFSTHGHTCQRLKGTQFLSTNIRYCTCTNRGIL